MNDGDARQTTESDLASAFDPELLRCFRGYALGTALATAALGGMALLGLIAGIPRLASLAPGAVMMKPNTAICFVLIGLGVALASGKTWPVGSAAVRVCAAIVALIGLATLSEYVIGQDFGIDQLLIVDPAGADRAFIPGRMAPWTAISFFLLGLALLVRGLKRDHAASTALLVGVFSGSVLTLTGYILGADEFYTLSGRFTPVALSTVIGFFLLSSGMLVIGSTQGRLRWLASPQSGGVMLRRLLPIALVVPVLIVWLRLRGQAMGLFGSIEFGAATVSVAYSLVSCGVLFWAATRLDRSDSARLRAERHATAAQYARSLIEASLDPLVTIGVDGRITDVNEATAAATGIPRDRMIGSDFSEYFTEPDKALAGYQRAFAKGYVSDYPLSIRHVSGKITDVLYNASVYRGPTGAVGGLFAAARDITARKNAEAELGEYHENLEQIVTGRTSALSKANIRLDEINKELEGFAYSVSHDLRTPLRAIDEFSRILLDDYADKLGAEGERVLNVVRDSTVKMNHLIDDILAFSRVGRAEIKAAPVDMEQLVKTILADPLAPALAGRAITLDIGKLPPVQGDRAMFERLWINLLDNSIKFTAAKPDARIEVGAATGDGETVYYVRDNGAGFDMQYAAKLFGVFQRLHGAEFPGTGIGLAIVKKIVTRHGGRVWAEGKPGEGATLYFALPTEETSHGRSQ